MCKKTRISRLGLSRKMPGRRGADLAVGEFEAIDDGLAILFGRAENVPGEGEQAFGRRKQGQPLLDGAGDEINVAGVAVELAA
jgi:hypothetical protein